MIRKIVSGGQTGADRAALDAAITLGIPHGGWIPKGRLTENGTLPDKYKLTEMPNTSYASRTEQNVIDSNGTIIISHGPLSEGSEYTRQMAIKHQRPWLHIDLDQMPAFKSATLISSWIDNNSIEILNVAGPRASKDSQIYSAVLKLIESVHYLQLLKTSRPEAGNLKNNSQGALNKFPQTVQDAVEILIAQLPLKQKATMANMAESELIKLNKSLGRYILNKFGLWSGNEKLMESCRTTANYPLPNADDAAAVIIAELWRKLKETHKLRIIK
jgi:hypothetical protein